ncbi:MAG: alkaline phosphatase [Cyclobacteriaceae bacterium]|nr:alkaline phosphatase [Cyclobacteriaceae bacterium]
MRYLFFFPLLVLAACNGTTLSSSNQAIEGNIPATGDGTRPKNIVLLIGDGMGLSQVSSAFYYKSTPSSFARFTNIGLIRTSAADAKITDSAAGATAFASGVKTYNAAIGMSVDSTAVPTIVEIVSEKNWKTGLIATSSITHATPASFFAHVTHRNYAEEIAAFMPASGVDFFAGGGLNYFSARQDSVDLTARLQENGFVVNTNALSTETPDPLQKYAYLLAPDGMPKMNDGRGDFLPNATRLALDYLSASPDGFFLMVEGSQIDWGGHANDESYLVSELIDFDATIGAVLDFAEQNGETLVIVTADHETGGYTLAADSLDYNTIKGSFSTQGHSTTLIPVFAFGPGSERFRGVYENTGIFDRMIESMP